MAWAHVVLGLYIAGNQLGAKRPTDIITQYPESIDGNLEKSMNLHIFGARLLVVF